MSIGNQVHQGLQLCRNLPRVRLHGAGQGSGGDSNILLRAAFLLEVPDGRKSGRLQEERMRLLRYLAVLAILLIPAAYTRAQVSIGVGVGPYVYGPEYGYGPPVCPYGYYGYSPYACAPYGYYGPSWFRGGFFIGAGPWLRGGYGYGRGFGHGYGYRGGYGFPGGYGYGRGGYGYARGGYGSGYRGGFSGGGRAFGGGGGFRGGGRR